MKLHIVFYIDFLVFYVVKNGNQRILYSGTSDCIDKEYKGIHLIDG